jgi:hypothetical protein
MAQVLFEPLEQIDPDNAIPIPQYARYPTHSE